MPKESRERSVSLDRSRLSPFPCSSRTRQSLVKDPLEDDKNIEQWETARCPVCMEHPHNAILLLCSSHEKGCRPFMCDTSYRHSNCFDQFRKSSSDVSEDMPGSEDISNLTLPLLSTSTVAEVAVSDRESERSEGSLSTPAAGPSEDLEKSKLVCPLCRGQINGWTVVKSARHFLNAKLRSCACETCDFNGTYPDLRKHARLVHPLVRPTDTDPERLRNWRRLEQQRDIGDLLSTLQSSTGEERSEESTLTVDEGGWLTVFFLVRFIRPGTTSSRSSSTRARTRVAVRRSLRRLWGETYDAEADPEDANESSDGGTGTGTGTGTRSSRRRYVRRRLNDSENQ